MGYLVPAYVPRGAGRPPVAAAPVLDPVDPGGLMFWLDASDASTLFQDDALTTPATADGHPVGGWKDKSTNAYHATQTTAGNRPKLKLGVASGRNVVRFDGRDGWVRSALGSAQKPFTVLAAVRATQFAGAQRTLMGGIGDYGRWFYTETDSGVLTLRSQGGGAIASATGGPLADTFAVCELSFSATGVWAFYVNGEAKGTGTNDAGLNNRATVIGGAGEFPGLLWLGDIAEMLQYDSVLADADRQKVEAYLIGKWVGGTGAAFVDPSSLTGLTFWLDSNDASTLFQDSALTTPAAADGDPVGGWKDKSDYGYHAVQATAGNRPTLKLGVQNGKNAVRFDGSNDVLGSALSSAHKPFTVIAVVRATNFSDYRTLLSGPGDYGMRWRIDSGSGLFFMDQQGASAIGASSAGPQANTFALCEVSFAAGGAWAFYVNGGAVGTGTSGVSFNARATTIGGAGEFPGQLWLGDMVEVLKYHKALTNTERALVEAYLNAKWAVY